MRIVFLAEFFLDERSTNKMEAGVLHKRTLMGRVGRVHRSFSGNPYNSFQGVDNRGYQLRSVCEFYKKIQNELPKADSFRVCSLLDGYSCCLFD